MLIAPNLRLIARQLPWVYRLVGHHRLKRHQRALRTAEREYAVDPSQSGLPPPHLRFRVHRALDPQSYINVGKAVASDLLRTLSDNHIDLEGRSALDFASGPGRVATWIKNAVPSLQITATDIDSEAITWAQTHLPDVADFHVNGMSPPLEYPEGAFDLCYSVSLFTHLDEKEQFAWLAELARVIKPGGYLLTTVHGEQAQTTCTPAERAALARRGFAFRTDHRGALKLDGLPDSYQTTFHTRDYVEREWTRYFEIVEYRAGGLQGHHDLVLLKRPERSQNQ